MSFLFPGALFLGLLIPVIAALYLRRPRRRRREVSTLQFWQKVFAREPNRRFLGRLRNPLSLLLQVLIFLLLLLALAGPERDRPEGRRSTVIVLDARARMQAGNGAVFQAARNAALNVAAHAGPSDEMSLLTVEGAPRILLPFSADSRKLRERLDALSASDAGGDIGNTLALAKNLLKSRTGQKRLVVITDRPLPAASGIEQILVGKPRDNAALLALAQRPLPASPQSAEIFAQMANFSAADRDVELELSLDGRAFDLQKFHLAAGATKDFSTIVPAEMLRTASQGLLVAHLLGNDSLPVDDTARVALASGEKLRALLITGNNPFLESALKADPGLDLEILAPAAWRSKMAASFDVVIFDDWTPPDAPPEDFQEGNFFFFGRSPFENGTAASPVSKVTVTDPQTPLLWNVDASDLRLASARPLRIPDGWRVTTVLANNGVPLVMSLERAGQARIVVTAFSVGSTNFPLRVGFPLFVSNALHWLAGRRPGDAQTYAAGQIFIPAAGEQIGRKPQRDAGALQEQESPSLTGNPLRLRKTGFYEIHKTLSSEETETSQSLSRWVAVSTANRDESDLRTAQANRNLLLLRSGGPSLHPWRWLAVGALILLLAEWVLHHRRVTE